MQAEMPIVDYNTCAKGNEKLGKVVDSLMICAGYGGDSKVSGCHGDSGGPLVCEDKKTGRWTLRGTVSWGDHYCNGGPTYSVFVRINSYIDWIKCKMISEPLQPSKLHKANPAYFHLLIDPSTDRPIQLQCARYIISFVLSFVHPSVYFTITLHMKSHFCVVSERRLLFHSRK